MDSRNKWIKYLNIIGAVVFILAIAYVSPISNNPLFSRVRIYFQRSPVPSVPDESWKYENGCPVHQFTSVKIASRSPDIMVIEGFLTKFEADHLIKLAYPLPRFSRCGMTNS